MTPAESPPRGSISDPDFRHRRAVYAAAQRTSVEHFIAKLVDAAPALTPEQRDRLAVLLRPTGGRQC